MWHEFRYVVFVKFQAIPNKHEGSHKAFAQAALVPVPQVLLRGALRGCGREVQNGLKRRCIFHLALLHCSTSTMMVGGRIILSFHPLGEF